MVVIHLDVAAPRLVLFGDGSPKADALGYVGCAAPRHAGGWTCAARPRKFTQQSASSYDVQTPERATRAAWMQRVLCRDEARSVDTTRTTLTIQRTLATKGTLST